MITPEQREQMADEASIRSNLYQVATAYFMSPPDEEFIEALRSSPLVPFEVDPGWKIEDLVQEYHDLFQVPTGAFVFPYESCYRGRHEEKPGGLMGPYAIQVQDFYRRAGYEVAPEAKELPDHAGVEFGLLRQLAVKEAAAWRAGEDDTAELWQRWQTAFIARHMGQWIPDLCSQIEAKTSQKYYRRFALWIRGFLSGEDPPVIDCPQSGAKQEHSTGGPGEGGSPPDLGCRKANQAGL